MPDICVLGASGRMGRQVLALAADDPDVSIVGAHDRDGSELIGREVAAGVAVTSDLEAAMRDASAYIDFTTPQATGAAARAAIATSTAAVVGTTGLDDDTEKLLAEASASVPVLVAPNFSLGVNLLFALAETAARALGDDFDAEVVELHHRRKRDAPSGTAIALAQALARGRGIDYDSAHRYSREGDVGARTDDEIGVVAVRGGDIIGEHTAYLIGELERIEITHRAASRTIFAAGAIKAAKWIARRPAGRYRMKDVLGL
jgi:4-hydroxy-tetrahydrodipicolinate reductase